MAPDRLLKLLKNLPDPQQTQMDPNLAVKALHADEGCSRNPADQVASLQDRDGCEYTRSGQFDFGNDHIKRRRFVVDRVEDFRSCSESFSSAG